MKVVPMQTALKFKWHSWPPDKKSWEQFGNKWQLKNMGVVPKVTPPPDPTPAPELFWLKYDDKKSETQWITLYFFFFKHVLYVPFGKLMLFEPKILYNIPSIHFFYCILQPWWLNIKVGTAESICFASSSYHSIHHLHYYQKYSPLLGAPIIILNYLYTERVLLSFTMSWGITKLKFQSIHYHWDPYWLQVLPHSSYVYLFDNNPRTEFSFTLP